VAAEGILNFVSGKLAVVHQGMVRHCYFFLFLKFLPEI
jgi:hypothetical protein